MDNNSFSYTYSSSQQEEIRKIREKYIPKQESKMEQLRRLDRKATQKGTMASLIVGTVSALVMGFGMCCTMVWADTLFVQGIIIGMVGIIGVALAYPVYSYVTKKEREKNAPEIIRIADELLQ